MYKGIVQIGLSLFLEREFRRCIRKGERLNMKIAVLDIGGTSIKSGIYCNDEILNYKETDTEAKKGGYYVIEKAKKILKDYGAFDRIGVSTAGQVNAKEGKIIYANENLPAYTGMNIKDLLEETFGKPAAVENDVNAAAIGEAYKGAGKGYDDFLCLTYGTGVGGAIVIDRKIYKGTAFLAGEFGGLIVRADQRDARKDILSGCYERYASTTALINKAMELEPSLKNGREIFERIGEAKVKLLVDNWIQEILYGLISFIHLFNPSCIILGGGVMRQQYIVEKIREVLYDNIIPSYRSVVIKQAELGNTAGMLGAAMLAKELQ
jgi:predicted NBD/HSP70 family sugar kinase